MNISKRLGKMNPREQHVSLWDKFPETRGNCFDECWSSCGTQQSVNVGDAQYITLQIHEMWGKVIYICKDSMRNEHCFRESSFKQERTEQKLPTEYLTSFSQFSNFCIQGLYSPSPPPLISLILKWTKSLLLETTQERLKFSENGHYY